MKKYSKEVFMLVFMYIVLCTVAIPFTDNIFLAIMLSLFMLYPVQKSLSLYKESKVKQKARDELKSLLEAVSTKLSNGNTLEISFLSSYETLKNLYGSNSYVCVALSKMKEKSENGSTFSECIKVLTSKIPCPESFCIFETISKTRHLGNSNLPIISQNLSMLSEIILVSKDISGEVSQKRLESMVMAIMPIITVFGFGVGPFSYTNLAFTFAFGRIIYATSYIICILAFCLGIVIVAQSVYKSPNSHKYDDNFSILNLLTKIHVNLSSKNILYNQIVNLFIDISPIEYILPIKRKLSYLYPKDEYILKKHVGIKIIITVSSIIIFTVFGIFVNVGIFPLIALTILLLVSHDLDINSKLENNKIVLMADLPGFVSLLCTLLSNGFVLQSALIMCIDTFSNSNNILKSELENIRADINSGALASEALDNFSNRCEISEISAALNLAGQFSKSGNYQTLNLLKIQTSSCFLQSKLYARKNLDKSSVKLLVPMMLHLICVIAISITPAILSFQNV